MTVLTILEIIGLQNQIVGKHEHICLGHLIVILLVCLNDRLIGVGFNCWEIQLHLALQYVRMACYIT